MSFENPTLLRIGMSGLFFGKHYRIAGRVVLGMEQGGATYYWNEFNLVNMEGQSATLVCERGEDKLEWRLFTLFEPKHPLTAAEAACKEVGEQIEIDGTPARITLVDQSRVYHIEGQAPEGVEVGDVADYFNAESADGLVVVSWTGEEVEFFRGVDLSAATVMSAFNLPTEKAYARLSPQPENFPAKHKFIKLATISVVFGVIALVAYLIFRSDHSTAKVLKAKKPVPALALGNKGTLNGKEYRVSGHAVVEVAEVSRRFEWHEYELSPELQGKALLIYGFTPETRDWILLSPVQPAESIGPKEAAAMPGGKTIELGGQSARITGLFQSSLRKSENAEAPDTQRGKVQFGFVARSPSNVFLARWSEKEIAFYAATPVSSKVLAEAFKGKQP